MGTPSEQEIDYEQEGNMNQCKNLEEAAAKLAVSPLTLRRWARDGKSNPFV